MNVLLDTNVLSEPLRERPDPDVMAQQESEEHVFHTTSVVIHELSYGIHRLPSGRKQQRLNSYLQGLLTSGLTVLPYDLDVIAPGFKRSSEPMAERGLERDVPPFVAPGQLESWQGSSGRAQPVQGC